MGGRRFFDRAQEEIGSLPVQSTATRIWLKVNGVWKKTRVFLKVNGIWYQVTTFLKDTGVWR